MKNNPTAACFAASFLGLTLACSQASFGGSSGSPGAASPVAGASATPGSDATPAAPAPTPTTDANSNGSAPSTPCTTDAVTLSYTSAQQDCIVNQGKTWDFENNECGTMKAATFACTWANVVTQMQTLGLLNSVIQTASTDGSKLVSCGQSADTNRLAVQFIGPQNGTMPPVACTGTPSTSVSITTGCYVHSPDGPAPAVPAGPSAAYDAYVYNCMDTL